MNKPRVILKFGGTSVFTLAHWNAIAHITRSRLALDQHPVLACSAATGISQHLEALCDATRQGPFEAPLQAIREDYLNLAQELGVDGPHLLERYFKRLDHWASDLAQKDEVGPAERACFIAVGEVMVTKLGVAFLQAEGINATWRDARSLLSAHCNPTQDRALQHLLAKDIVTLTQGSIARNVHGATVLFQGGSDTAAACLAAKLGAKHVMKWTDVPGVFTADPRRVPSARLLTRLSYSEAKAIAHSGAHVLNPGSIAPLHTHGIALHIRSINTPDTEGTVIVPDSKSEPTSAQVVAISLLQGITLVAIRPSHRWYAPDFLTQVCAELARSTYCIRFVATSTAGVTLSIGADRGKPADPDLLRDLLFDLCPPDRIQVVPSCAAVNLVGRHLGAIPDGLGPALEALRGQVEILATHASHDTSLTFIVQASEAHRLVTRMHNHLLGHRTPGTGFGPTYQALLGEPPVISRSPWWRRKRQALLQIAGEASPCFVYDEASLHEAAEQMLRLSAIDRCFYAIKASHHPSVLRAFYQKGLGFECVSLGELELIRQHFPKLDPERILFTPNFVPQKEYETGFGHAGHVTLDGIRPLELWPETFASRHIMVRVDPGRGHGHHRHVRTAGAQSKFGVVPEALPRVAHLAKRAGATVVGLHAHVGSGILQRETWLETARFLASFAEQFSQVRLLNIGGGFGVPEHPGAVALDLDALNSELLEFRKAHPQLSLWVEPGRYLVAEAGVLLARVTQIKKKGNTRYVGIETGMNSLIRPALYGACHRIVNLSRLGEPCTITAEVVGPICETGDTLGHAQRLPPTQEGDVLLIATAGAYGRTMSSDYNLRPPATERLLRRR